ncbi:hypothetical protein PVNG_03405 [Plasmodium vivax North Korean]|uniref:Uncharacterized protein n=1 Tax=Plasmodium vivax North Korean TaxID=1035514 RepID=A0A0J9TVJ1_PLAVI|nr:hypothetical protein PVNG_03405 [Plasmodium vivax North Korean]
MINAYAAPKEKRSAVGRNFKVSIKFLSKKKCSRNEKKKKKKKKKSSKVAVKSTGGRRTYAEPAPRHTQVHKGSGATPFFFLPPMKKVLSAAQQTYDILLTGREYTFGLFPPALLPFFRFQVWRRRWEKRRNKRKKKEKKKEKKRRNTYLHCFIKTN